MPPLVLDSESSSICCYLALVERLSTSNEEYGQISIKTDVPFYLNDRKKAQGHHHLSLNIFENMWSKNRPNCTPVYRRWWYPVGLQAKSNILNLWTWSSLNLFRKFGLAHSQKMDDITYCRNMHNLVWFLITDSGGFRFGLIWFLSLSFGENLECIFTLRHNVTQKSMKSMLMHSCRFIVNDAFCNSNAFYAFLIFFWNNNPIKGSGVSNIQIIYL